MSNGGKRLFKNFLVISEGDEQSITSHRDLPNSLREDGRLHQRGQATTSEHRRQEGNEQETPKSFVAVIVYNISVIPDKSLPLPGLHFLQCKMRESAYPCGLQPWKPPRGL